MSPGQHHEARYFEVVMDSVKILRPRGRPRCRPDSLAGDRAYSIPRLLAWLRHHGIASVIPPINYRHKRKGRPRRCDRTRYRRRNVIERCVGWLKESRRIGTRYEKLAANYLAMIHIAIIKRYIKTLLSDRA